MSNLNSSSTSESVQEFTFQSTSLPKSSGSFSKGFALVAIGAVILLGSCVFSLTLSFSDPSFQYIMYGATTLGALMVLAGLGCCLGW